jgi:hypothetical protein
MSTDVADVPRGGMHVGSTAEPTTHALHIKDLPHEIWCRARHNANLSGLAYRDFVIRVLAESQPFPRQADPSSAN